MTTEEEAVVLLQGFVDDASYVCINDLDIETGRTVHRLFKCRQCSTAKGAQHSAECVVGKAEAFLRHLEA